MVTCIKLLSAISSTFLVNLIFQPKACNGCHDLTQKSMSFNDVEIVTVFDSFLGHD